MSDECLDEVRCGCRDILSAGVAQAQTADEAVEKVLTAMGGRAALAKLTTRIATGAISVSTQGMDIGGTAEFRTRRPTRPGR